MRENLIKLAVAIIIAVIIMGSVFVFSRSIGNRQIGLDTIQTFKKFILLINDDIIEGYVKSWRDFEESDVIQFTDTNDITYLTHYSNVILTTGEIK